MGSGSERATVGMVTTEMAIAKKAIRKVENAGMTIGGMTSAGMVSGGTASDVTRREVVTLMVLGVCILCCAKGAGCGVQRDRTSCRPWRWRNARRKSPTIYLTIFVSYSWVMYSAYREQGKYKILLGRFVSLWIAVLLDYRQQLGAFSCSSFMHFALHDGQVRHTGH
jgi:hypothetical protein